MPPTPDSLRDRFIAALTETLSAAGRETRLVIAAGPVYVITIADHRGALIQEAVASAALPPELKLSSERGQLLRDLGFKKRGGGRRNWTRTLERKPAAIEGHADELLDIFTRVYGVSEAPVLTLTQDQREHPENPALVDAMRKVSKGFNEEARRAMYSTMLNATFLVPLDPEAGEEVDDADALLDLGDHPSGRPTLAGFSDWTSLRLWKPLGWKYLPIHGSDVFELALQRKVASFRINPEGDVGGELYAHEVEMLVEAVRGFQRRHRN